MHQLVETKHICKMFIEDKQIYLLAFRHVIVKGLHFDACLSCDQVFDDVGVGVNFHIVLYLASSKKILFTGVCDKNKILNGERAFILNT